MVLEREEGSLTIRWPRSRTALFGLVIAGSFFLLLGTLSLLMGQHLPQMTSLGTFVWAYITGIPLFLWGLCFIGDKRLIRFTREEVYLYDSKWRFIEWQLRYKRKQLLALSIVPQARYQRSRLLVEIKGNHKIEIAQYLESEDAWHLATLLAELTDLPIRG